MARMRKQDRFEQAFSKLIESGNKPQTRQELELLPVYVKELTYDENDNPDGALIEHPHARRHSGNEEGKFGRGRPQHEYTLSPKVAKRLKDRARRQAKRAQASADQTPVTA